MALEPVVNRLESSMSDTVNFIKLNVKDHIVDELSKQLDLEVTPTFIFFGRDGIEQWRSVGHLDPRRIKKSMLA